MIISPPFLPEAGLAAPTGMNPDPMMDAVDKFECDHGIYPIAIDRRWHCGVHLQPDTKGKVHAIADGEVVAYRVCQHGVDGGVSHPGFVLLKHTTETGEGRTLTFYSLYMHLLPLAEYQQHRANAKEMPEFLRLPTGSVNKGQVTPAVSGDGKKVRRKDVLGWRGEYEGMPHLHFEIFMLPADFDAYFGCTQLGKGTPTPPTGTDWWGHAYFVIPAGSTFRRLPEKADAGNKLHGIEFKPGQEGSNALPLLVETYFSVGSKYTNVWSVAQDGTRTLLTPQPVEEKDYEYDLYKRATALYSSCPSDGYELLRFGRILSPSQTLAANARATWMKVNWAADKVGYIDINDSGIHKFSDADFLSCMGWQKVSEGNTPFSSDGLCDVDALKTILNDAAPHDVPAVAGETAEAHKKRVLSAYVKGNAQVRRQLRRLVCHALSEWDSTNNEGRYARLLDEGGFYHGNEKGYKDFLKYLKEVQFWDKTGLPAGQKLWFFHPLEFIRYFRRCGWLAEKEIVSTLPKYPYYSMVNGLYQAIKSSRISTLTKEIAKNRLAEYVAPLNSSMRKYGISNSRVRQSHFLAQILLETDRWNTIKEYGDGKYNPGQPATEYYAAFYGRGCLQLTWAGAYDDYGSFKAFPENGASIYVDPRINRTSIHWFADPRQKDKGAGKIVIKGVKGVWYPRFDPQIIAESRDFSCDSAGFFWIFKHHSGVRNINRIADKGIGCEEVGRVSVLVNGGVNGYYERQAFSVVAASILTDMILDGVMRSITPPNKKTIVIDLEHLKV
ncbi:M23 family metallopeptidase [Burkholderia ambifaria]|uniref:M23 family metallopeptidase n=1 Tax=Burkholderia ambifaria TaxID=152480 RepID=UPI00158B5933|nr:M23 family metallopeptidase [Burkholderia ambifaria]